MSYIDALYKKDEDKIYVVERDSKKVVCLLSMMQDMYFIIQMLEANIDLLQVNHYKKYNVQHQKNSLKSNV